MKKHNKRLTIATETLRVLSGSGLKLAQGGVITIDKWTNPDQTASCACSGDTCGYSCQTGRPGLCCSPWPDPS